MDKEKPTPKPASPEAMLMATRRANAAIASRAQAFYYGGNLGDSIERRFTGYSDLLGGGSDWWHGSHGTNQTYPALNYGGYYGAGQPIGPGARGGPWTTSGSGAFKYLKRFSGNSTFYHQIIAQCILAYHGYGVVRNIIDLYADFATEGVEIVHPDESVQNFYKAWAKQIKLSERVHRIFSDIFTTGNVFIHRSWAKLTDTEKRILKRATAENVKIINGKLVIQGKKSYKEINPQISKVDNMLSRKEISSRANDDVSNLDVELPDNPTKRIPWKFTSLNPLQIEHRGKKFKGEDYWVIALDKTDTEDLLESYGGNGHDLGSSKLLPKELKGKLSKYKGRGVGYTAEVRLDNAELFIIQDRKFDYWDWAIPFTFPALKALNFKDCLRNMEMKACETVINSIFLFKLGNSEKGMQAEDEHFERLADMLQVPGNSLNIIWNDLIDAEVISADVSKLFDPKKHESADKDILTSLGVPEVLLGGKGGNFSNSFISVATILEKIDSARIRVEDWLLSEIKIIADAMGFRKLPTLKWGQTSLRDKNAERQLMINLFDRGIVSAESALKEFDLDLEIEVARQKKEKEITDITGVGVLDKRGPYLSPEKMADLGAVPKAWDEEHGIKKIQEETRKAKNQPQSKSAPKTSNGRPGGKKESTSRGPQTNKRSPQGQGLASYDEYEELRSVGQEMLLSLEDRMRDKLLKARGIDYIKQAKKEDRSRLEGLVYNVFSNLPPKPKHFETDDFLNNILANKSLTSRMKADVLSNYHSKIANYEERFGKEPSQEHRRQFIVSAWTQSAIHLYNSGLV